MPHPDAKLSADDLGRKLFGNALAISSLQGLRQSFEVVLLEFQTMFVCAEMFALDELPGSHSELDECQKALHWRFENEFREIFERARGCAPIFTSESLGVNGTTVNSEA